MRGDRSDVEPVTLDVTVEESVRRCVADTIGQAGRIDALVYSAGFYVAGAAEETSAELAMAQFEVYQLGAHRLLRALLPGMREARGGRLVFTVVVRPHDRHVLRTAPGPDALTIVNIAFPSPAWWAFVELTGLSAATGWDTAPTSRQVADVNGVLMPVVADLLQRHPSGTDARGLVGLWLTATELLRADHGTPRALRCSHTTSAGARSLVGRTRRQRTNARVHGSSPCRASRRSRASEVRCDAGSLASCAGGARSSSWTVRSARRPAGVRAIILIRRSADPGRRSAYPARSRSSTIAVT